MTQPVALGEPLTLDDVERVARGAPGGLGDGARDRMRASRDVIERAVAGGDVVYGVTTGFGALADTRIEPSQAAALQRGIVTSHATTVCPEVVGVEVRATRALRRHEVCLGHTGLG